MTTTAAYTLYQKMTKAGMDENVANAFVEYEAERSEDVLTSKDGQVIIEKITAMEVKADSRAKAMEANIKAEIASNRTSTYQAVTIGTGLILAAIGIATSFLSGGGTP